MADFYLKFMTHQSQNLNPFSLAIWFYKSLIDLIDKFIREHQHDGKKMEICNVMRESKQRNLVYTFTLLKVILKDSHDNPIASRKGKTLHMRMLKKSTRLATAALWMSINCTMTL
jgi:hypothetical protein